MRVFLKKPTIATTVLLFAGLMAGGCAPGAVSNDGALETQPVVWYEGEQTKTAWPAPDERAVFTRAGIDGNGCQQRLMALLGGCATVIEHASPVWLIRLPPSARQPCPGLEQRVRATACVAGLGMVYYRDANRNPASRLIHGNEIIVRFRQDLSEGEVEALGLKFGLKRNATLAYAPNTIVYRLPRSDQVIGTANRLHALDEVVYAYPNWLRQMATR